jgi:hypothetical protein
VPPGTWTVSGGLGEDLRKPPTDASPSAEIEFTLSKKWFSRRSPSAMPARWGVGVCTGPASKSELFGNRSVPQRRVRVARKNAQAIFCRRRHQARRPPLAKIRPGSPAPTMGPGTAANPPNRTCATSANPTVLVNASFLERRVQPAPIDEKSFHPRRAITTLSNSELSGFEAIQACSA